MGSLAKHVVMQCVKVFSCNYLIQHIMQDMINDGYTDILIDILATAEENEL